MNPSIRRVIAAATGVLAIGALAGPAAASTGDVWFSGIADSTDGLFHMPLSGGAPVNMTAGTATRGSTLDSATGTVYATTITSLLRVALPGGSRSTLTTFTTQDGNGLTLAPALRRVYWGVYNGSPNRVSWASFDGAPTATTGLLYSSASLTHMAEPVSPLADPDNGLLYWANRASRTIGAAALDGTSTLADVVTPNRAACPASGGSDTGEYLALAVDSAAGVAYVGTTSGKLLKVTLANGACTVLYTASSNVAGIALDPGESMLYLGIETGAVQKVSTSGGPATTLATGGATLSRARWTWIHSTPSGVASIATTGDAIGSVLTCSSTWGVDRIPLNYFQAPLGAPTVAWYRDGAPVAGATAATLTTTAGGSYTCRVTAANAAGATVAESSAVSILPPPSAPEPSGASGASSSAAGGSGSSPAPAPPVRPSRRLTVRSTTCDASSCITTGRAPAGAIQVMQRAVRTGDGSTRGGGRTARSVSVARRCVLRGADIGAARAYRCSIRLGAGRWVLTTRALAREGALARASRAVVVRGAARTAVTG